MSFNWGLIADNLPLLLQGALVTVEITAMSVGCGFFIGLLVSLANLSKFRLVRLLAKCYVDIIRGTPLLVQIFLIYFALPLKIRYIWLLLASYFFICAGIPNISYYCCLQRWSAICVDYS